MVEVVEAITRALEPLVNFIDGLQLYPYYNVNPTPPSIDMYPGDPFQTDLGFSDGGSLFFTVRARTTTADSEAGQRALLRMLDRDGPTSVYAALTADQTLGGVVDSLAVTPEGVSGYREYIEDTFTGGRLLGVEWRLVIFQ